MNEAATLLIERLAAAAAAGAPVDIHALLGDMTMQVVGTSAFGCATQHQTRPQLGLFLYASRVNAQRKRPSTS